jgi:membrane-bound metal-dependent hydrolase YbcI (DUF457 family)
MDLFLLWGFDMRGVHRGFSHSVFIGLCVTAIIWTVLGGKRWVESLAYGLALLSHTVLDFVAAKDGGGVMLLWPFSMERFKLGLWGFVELSPGLPRSELIHWTLREAILFVPLLLIVMCIRNWSQPSKVGRH